MAKKIPKFSYCRNMKQALGRLMRRNGYEICHLG